MNRVEDQMAGRTITGVAIDNDRERSTLTWPLLVYYPDRSTADELEEIHAALGGVTDSYILVAGDAPSGLTFERHCPSCKRTYPVTIAELKEIARTKGGVE